MFRILLATILFATITPAMAFDIVVSSGAPLSLCMNAETGCYQLTPSPQTPAERADAICKKHIQMAAPLLYESGWEICEKIDTKKHEAQDAADLQFLYDYLEFRKQTAGRDCCQTSPGLPCCVWTTPGATK
jgi:hypothetical protein